MTIKHFNFVGKKNIFFAISCIIIAIIIIVSLVFGVPMDVQFKGGSIITYSHTGTIDFEEMESFIEKTINERVRIDEKKGIAGKDSFDIVLASTEGLNAEKQATLTAELAKKYGNQLEFLANSSVDPVIGKEFLFKGLLAVGLASLIIVIYVAFRFKKINGLSAGVTAVVALFHDVIIVFGTFVIFRIPLDDNFIAVVLTILGFSINDTIIIYDRIRENKKLYGKKLAIGELVNNSINETLSRTLNTAICVLATMVIVCVVAVASGVSSILSFSLPLMVGLVSGSYSTIFIAGPLWVMWQNHKTKKLNKA